LGRPFTSWIDGRAPFSSRERINQVRRSHNYFGSITPMLPFALTCGDNPALSGFGEGEVWPLWRVVAALTGGALGVCAGLAVLEGQFVVVSALIPIAGLAMSSVWIVPSESRRSVAILTLLAFAFRAAAAALIYSASWTIGKGGFTTGDDRGYADAAWAVAQFLH